MSEVVKTQEDQIEYCADLIDELDGRRCSFNEKQLMEIINAQHSLIVALHRDLAQTMSIVEGLSGQVTKLDSRTIGSMLIG